MNDTPRTDSYVYKFPGCQREPRLIDFARQLEKELAGARAEIERKDNLIEQMREALRLLRCCGNCLHCTSYDHMGADAQYCELDVNDFEEGQTCKELDKWEPQTEPIKSALAAERGK